MKNKHSFPFTFDVREWNLLLNLKEFFSKEIQRNGEKNRTDGLNMNC